MIPFPKTAEKREKMSLNFCVHKKFRFFLKGARAHMDDSIRESLGKKELKSKSLCKMTVFDKKIFQFFAYNLCCLLLCNNLNLQ